MDKLCITCLCADRNLIYIGGTELQHIYLQLLNEPVTKLLESYLQICWECKAILNRFQQFKTQTQSCYTKLWNHVHQGISQSIVRPPNLTVRSVVNVNIIDKDVKEEIHNELETFADELTLEKTKKVSKKKVKLKRSTKHNKKKVKVKTEDIKLTSDVDASDMDLDDPFIDQIDEKPLSEVQSQVDEEFEPHVEQTIRDSKDSISHSIIQSSHLPDVDITDKDVKDEEHYELQTFADDLKMKKTKKVCKKKVKLKRSTKQKKEKEKIKPAPDVDVSDMEHGDHFTDQEKPMSEVESQVIDKEYEPQEQTKDVKLNGAPKTRSREVLPDKPQCVECGKMFSSRKTYRYHLNVLHKGQNRYPCPRCGKVYQWKSNLGRHMRSHKALDSGELYCGICDKKFASVATYRQHLRGSRRHVSETDFSFMCNECGKKFVNKTRLRDHIDWEHLNNIKFKCQLCDKPFKCHTSLYVHLQNVHKNREKKDNLCHVCGKSYQNAAKLRYHIVAMHTTETPYRCERCGAAFGWYSSLYRHVREVHHKMNLQPKKCKKSKKVDEVPMPTPGMPHQLLPIQ